MDAPEPEAACREVILEWRTLSELATYAERRHGYGNDNGGFGVRYPTDLDEYETQVLGMHIPAGSLLAYGYAFANPPGYEILVNESLYLRTLSKIFRELGSVSDAERIDVLLKELANPSE